MSEEKIFADGFSFKRQENAPDFVIGRLSIKLDEAIAFLKKHEKNGWVNLNAKYGRSGNPYLELDTYEPKKSAAPQPNNGSAPQPKATAKPKSKAEPAEELPF